MKNISISELRTNLLRYLKNAQHGEPINVTSKGVSLAVLTAPVSQRDAARSKLGKLAKTAIIHDVVAPIGDNWDVCQ